MLTDSAPPLPGVGRVELKRRAVRGRSARENFGIRGRAEGRSEESYDVLV